MLPALTSSTQTVRVLRRKAVRQTVRVTIIARRPSLLDARLRGDPWILHREDGTLALCFDAWEMAAVAASPFDLPSLNALLHQVRHRCPRRRAG
jgi:hypothetical protein